MRTSRTIPTISVIVPVYNVEQYLDKCIDSILSQTFSDFELLLIDDGSTDGSSLICKNACERDERIHYYRKANGGLSDARNFGLNHIRGEYVSFVDSDDWIDETYLECLYSNASASRAEISTCNFKIQRGENSIHQQELNSGYTTLSTREALLALLLTDKINVSANSKLFKSKLFDDIRFPQGKHFEDVGTTYKLLKKAKNVSVGSASLYNYLMRPGSITHSKNESVFDRAELAKQAYDDLNGSDVELSIAAERYYVVHALSVLHSCNLRDTNQRAKANSLRNDVLNRKNRILSSEKVSKRDKIALHALSLGLKPYQLAWNLYCIATGRK